ncbi:MAG: hypothetical protein C5B49_00415 [Bdellovibrio sp.]|nr:MAG: hypothetical protein C5B49_00415 [Bdellovibrio sp.]
MLSAAVIGNRALREVKTNARILAATSQNLEKMIQTGGFREDLFYRLNVMPIIFPRSPCFVRFVNTAST